MANIILVDDDIALLEFTSASLKNAGHTISSFTDGLSAYNELQKNSNFDIILTDIIMPGMDGLELADKAKQLIPEIKIMFMSGFSGVGSGNMHVMSKPFHLKDLLKEIETTLNK